MMANIKIKAMSRCAKCSATKSFCDKIKDKDELGTIVPQFLLDSILQIKTC